MPFNITSKHIKLYITSDINPTSMSVLNLLN